MFQVSREIDFCYGHRLLDYGGTCRHLHRHNGRVMITIETAGLDPTARAETIPIEGFCALARALDAGAGT